jgi:hypothetical protein
VSPPPDRPKIYHITHVDNLPAIISRGGLVSDAEIVARGGPAQAIGMSNIKRRRLALPVGCHPGDCVGDYVPFYFCPRSVMLYVIHCANHPELTYRGGQRPIVHLEADLLDVAGWAGTHGKRWAFSLSNAAAVYAEFRASLDQLGELNWLAVAATAWGASDVKEAKQAEFLVHGSFPWELVSRVGVYSAEVRTQVQAGLQATAHRPEVEVMAGWYY